MTSPINAEQPEPTRDETLGVDRGVTSSAGESTDWPSAPATEREIARPGAVTAALVVLWISNTIGVFAVVTGFTALSELTAIDSPEAAGAAGYATLLMSAAAVVLALQVVGTIAVAKGKKWARILLTVLFVIDIVLKVMQLATNPAGIVGIGVGILVISLLFSRSANAWFNGQQSPRR